MRREIRRPFLESRRSSSLGSFDFLQWCPHRVLPKSAEDGTKWQSSQHAVAIRKEILEQNPWLAEALFNAYSEAKKLAYQDMAQMGWVNDMLPWYGQELEETRALMGKNFYSYGIEDNRKTLQSLFRYSHEQGLSRRELTIEELFAPQSLELREA